MDTVTSSPSSPPPLASPVDVGPGERDSSTSFEVAGRFLIVVIIVTFALVGTPIGAVAGAVIGLATQTGLFRGAVIGAISGVLFSIEAVESSITLWHSNQSGIWSIFYVIDDICSLLSGGLVQEKVGSAVQNQISVVDSLYMEALDIFEASAVNGMSRDSINLLPKLQIASESSMDCSGQRLDCSVCLQDIHVGEISRSLPHCKHIFHLDCIDCWLIRHGSCPLCRREI